MKDPNCANWKVWRGKEIEGHSGLGIETLFFREATWDVITNCLAVFPSINRFWFCEEFGLSDASELITSVRMLLIRERSEICVAIRTSPEGIIPNEDLQRLIAIRNFRANVSSPAVRSRIRFYYKLPISSLNDGDHLCVGRKFADEAFRIGDGKKVSPEDYAEDIFIA